MSTKLKEILTKNGPYPTTLNPNISQAKADPGLALAMFNIYVVQHTIFIHLSIENFGTNTYNIVVLVLLAVHGCTRMYKFVQP